MNRRKAKKRKNNTYLLCSQYIYIKPSEWNRVKNKSKLIKRRFLMGKLDNERNKNNMAGRDGFRWFGRLWTDGKVVPDGL
jgi:hypothetical protein